MADIQTFTTERNYPLPDPANSMRNDVQRIAAAATLIDADMAVALRAATNAAMGRVRFATDAEAKDATNTTTVITPGGLASALTAWTASDNDVIAGTSHALFATPAGVSAKLTSMFATEDTALAGLDRTSLMSPYLTKRAVDNAVGKAVGDLVGGSVAALDTLKELATALGNDPNFAATMTTSLAGKFDKAGGRITGDTTFDTFASFGKGIGLSNVNGSSLQDDTNFNAGLGRARLSALGDRFEVTNRINSQYILQMGLDGTFKFKNFDVWHSGNINPLPIGGGALTGRLSTAFQASGSMAQAGGDLSPLQVWNDANNANAAFMTFHRRGSYAVYLGLDTDNFLKVGGWSMGAVAYKIFHEGFRDASKMDVSGTQAFSGGVTTKGGSFFSDSDSNRHYWFRTAAGIARAVWYNEAATGSVVLNIYDANGGYVRNAVFEQGGTFTWRGKIVAGGSDLMTHRDNASGYLYMGSASQHLFGNDGSNFVMNGAGNLYVNGKAVWHSGNFSPSSFVGAVNPNIAYSVYVNSDAGNPYAQLQLQSNENGYGYIDFAHLPYGHSDFSWRLYHDTTNNRMSLQYIGAGDKFVVNTSGQIWGSDYGWLHDYFSQQGGQHRAAGYSFSTGQAYIYTDPNTNNVVLRSGPNPNLKYASLNDAGRFTVHSGGITALGSGIFSGDLIVGDGQTNSRITLVDTDEGNRAVHNNSGTIGFLGADGDWKLRVFDDGNVWTSMYGFLGDTFARKYRPEVAQTLFIRGVDYQNATLSMFVGGVIHYQWLANSDGNMYLRNGDSGSVYQQFANNGNIWTPSYGWLHDQFSSKASGNMQQHNGDLRIYKAYPTLNFYWNGLAERSWQLRENGAMYLMNGGTGLDFFDGNGALWCNHIGDYITNWVTNNFISKENVNRIGIEGNNKNYTYIDTSVGVSNLVTSNDRRVMRMNRENGYVDTYFRDIGSYAILYQASDATIKGQITATEEDSLSKLLSLSFKDFNYLEGFGFNATVRQQSGLIAQDVQALDTNWIVDVKGGKLQLNTDRLLTSTMHAVQQLAGYFADTEYEVAVLKARLSAVEARLAA